MPDVDVLVAGAGAAGLAAALAAAQGSASVLVVEANANFRRSCNTVLSTSMIPAGGSRWQRAAGIADSPERFLADVVAKTHGAARPVVAEALARVAPAVVEWLADECGIALQLVDDFDYPGHSARRCHAVADRSGASLHHGLLDAVRRADRIAIDVPCRLVDVTTGPSGAVTGALLRTPDGVSESVTAGAVVLASNGFAADADLVARHLPEMSGALYFGSEASTGDALRIGGRLGADVAGLDAYQGHGSVAVPEGVLLTWAAVMHGAVLVNGAGVRFGDESRGYSEFGSLVLAQPGGTAWVVLDATIDRRCRAFADYQRCVRMGALRWADDSAELARLTGLPAAALNATLDAVVRAREHGGDEYGRTHWPHRLAPPYAAVKVTGALFHTQGGLSVDGQARVLRDDEPIPGLYAAGGAAVGISGHGADGYLAGNGLLAALGLGYLAGRSAVREAGAQAETRTRARPAE